jgi:putative transposase
MKKKRFSTEQIIKILKEAELGISVQELCRKHGVSRQTFYSWRTKYGGMEISDALKLKVLDEENRKLKRLVADLSLDNQVLKNILEKNF